MPVGDDIATKWQKIWGSFWVCNNDLKDPTANCFSPMNCCLDSLNCSGFYASKSLEILKSVDGTITFLWNSGDQSWV